jgi:hypothetical protein
MRELADEVGIDLAGSFAYTDSDTDLPMLEAVGNPVLVNPDKALRRLAEERGWQTETFQNPITLRSRLPQLEMPEMTVVGGLKAAAGVASVAAVAWWVSRKTSARRG